MGLDPHYGIDTFSSDYDEFIDDMGKCLFVCPWSLVLGSGTGAPVEWGHFVILDLYPGKYEGLARAAL